MTARRYEVAGNVITLHGVGPRHIVPDPLGLALERLEAEVVREVHEEPALFLERARRARRRERVAWAADGAKRVALGAGWAVLFLIVVLALAGSSR